jgi:hypothetical protein
MKRNQKFILTVIVYGLVLLFTVGCSRNPYHVDISSVDLEIKIKRFEKDLFSLDFDSITGKIPWFYDKYGDFFDLYNYKIINIGGAGQKTYPDYLKIFLTDYLNNEVYNKTMEVFPDLADLEKELTKAFKHYNYYFPLKEIPEIITYVSRFNQSVVTAEGIIGIGLDKYLGRECNYYSQLGLNQYTILNMHKEKIPTDCMMAWGLSEFEYNDSVDNLLSNMIYHGQIMFFVKSMLPDQPDSLIMGFTSSQMQFCRMNESRMWEYLVEKKLLFETDRMTISKFTGYGPFTKDFTRESPARAAIWIGWRIIEAYARNNPDKHLNNIMNETNYQQILTLSKYNP